MTKYKTCAVEGCDRKHLGKGLCSLHYKRAQRGRSFYAPVSENLPATCVVKGCEKPRYARDMCSAHYMRDIRGRLDQKPREVQPAPPDGKCTLPHCERKHYARGLCGAHYKKKSQGKAEWDQPINPYLKLPKNDTLCLVRGCTENRHPRFRGMCVKHYTRYYEGLMDWYVVENPVDHE